jgi:hypothetical protein
MPRIVRGWTASSGALALVLGGLVGASRAAGQQAPAPSGATGPRGLAAFERAVLPQLLGRSARALVQRGGCFARMI